MRSERKDAKATTVEWAEQTVDKVKLRLAETVTSPAHCV